MKDSKKEVTLQKELDDQKRLRGVAEARLKIMEERVVLSRSLMGRYENEIEILRSQIVALRKERDKLLKLLKGAE